MSGIAAVAVVEVVVVVVVVGGGGGGLDLPFGRRRIRVSG